MQVWKIAITLSAILGVASGRSWAVEELGPGAAASREADNGEAEQAIKGFSVPKEFQCELVAAEPLLANPVAFSIDEQGRFYVAETFRCGAGVPDIRGRMHWLDTELASRTVA